MGYKKYLGFAGGLVGVLGAHLVFSSNFLATNLNILSNREYHIEQNAYRAARTEYLSGMGLIVAGMGMTYARMKLAPNYKEKR